jgi:uncharacterized protein YcgI (DUF1989 family)
MTDSTQLFPPFAEEMLPGGGHRSFVLKRGQLLRLTDLRGGANVSLTLLNANEKTERLNRGPSNANTPPSSPPAIVCIRTWAAYWRRSR